MDLCAMIRIKHWYKLFAFVLYIKSYWQTNWLLRHMTLDGLVEATDQILHPDHQNWSMIPWYLQSWTVPIHIWEKESIWVFLLWITIGWSRNRTDLRSTISKTRNIQIGNTYALMKFIKFQTSRTRPGGWAWPPTFLEVRSLGVTCWHGPTWPGIKMCIQCAELMS